MFTLQEKEHVLNANADLTVFETSTGTVRATSDAIVSTDTLAVKGFGNFPITSITDFKMNRSQAAVAEVTDWLVVAPTSIAVGEAVEVKITYKTNRYAGEDAINYIGGSRPIVFQTAALTGVTAANIRDAIVTGWAAYLATFSKFDPKISVTADGAADLRVTVATGHEYVTIAKVEIRRIVQGAGSQTAVSLAKTEITAGSEGLGLGKELEESYRMATAAVNNPYGIGGDDWRVDVRGVYTQCFFKVASTYSVPVSTMGVDVQQASEQSYMIFLNEANCLGANEAINDLAAIAVIVAGLLSNVSVTVDATPDNTEALIIADGTSVAIAAAFIA